MRCSNDVKVKKTSRTVTFLCCLGYFRKFSVHIKTAKSEITFWYPLSVIVFSCLLVIVLRKLKKKKKNTGDYIVSEHVNDPSDYRLKSNRETVFAIGKIGWNTQDLTCLIEIREFLFFWHDTDFFFSFECFFSPFDFVKMKYNFFPFVFYWWKK